MFVIYSHIVSDGGLKLAFESGRALLTVTAGVIHQLYGTKIRANKMGPGSKSFILIRVFTV